MAALLAVAVLALLAAALAPWSVASDRIESAAAAQVRDAYGLTFASARDARLSLLPVPRLTMSGVSVASETGSPLVRDARVRVEFRMLPLLLGRLRVAEVAVSGASVAVGFDAAGRSGWTPAFERIAQRGTDEASGHVGRLVVTGSDIVIDLPSQGTGTTIHCAEMVISWPAPAGEADLSVVGAWHDEPFRVELLGIAPFKLVAGQSDAIQLRATAKHGRVGLSGDLDWRGAPRFHGLIAADTPSLAGLAAWAGSSPILRGMDQSFSLSGDGTVEPTGIESPQVRLGFGADRVDGSLAIRLDQARPMVRATLAGEQLDLTWLGQRLAAFGETWSETGQALDVPPADYDLRLSAASARVGAVRLRDAAAGLLVHRDRLELSLARATLADGQVKGRVSAALGGEGRDIKASLSLDNVDLGPLLAQFGQARILTGTVRGQAAFEAVGQANADFARQGQGRLSVVARDGELAGVALGEGWRRSENRAGAAAPAAWQGGRTIFDQAHLNLHVVNGVAEIADGAIEASTTHTRLQGRVSLPDRFVSLKSTTRGAPAVAGDLRPPLVLDVNGPLDRLVTMSSPVTSPTTTATIPRR